MSVWIDFLAGANLKKDERTNDRAGATSRAISGECPPRAWAGGGTNHLSTTTDIVTIGVAISCMGLKPPPFLIGSKGMLAPIIIVNDV